jgi:hypothetical protein
MYRAQMKNKLRGKNEPIPELGQDVKRGRQFKCFFCLVPVVNGGDKFKLNEIIFPIGTVENCRFFIFI